MRVFLLVLGCGLSRLVRIIVCLNAYAFYWFAGMYSCSCSCVCGFAYEPVFMLSPNPL